jgi:hypothetical protein
MKRRVLWRTAQALVLLTLAAGASAVERDEPGDPDNPRDAAAAAYSLKVHLDLERARLDRSLSEYTATEIRREEIRDRLTLLYQKLGAAVRRGSVAHDGDDDEESLAQQIDSAERQEATTTELMRRLREQIADSRERMRFIQDRLVVLQKKSPAEEPEGLGGSWDVVYAPSNDRAVFSLRQSGAIIEGEYQQDGGFRGSLQGTLINNKLVLHRIDSKLGAVSDLEGQVSLDQKSIKGTWLSRLIGDGTASTGAWTGKKREPRKKPEAASP